MFFSPFPVGIIQRQGITNTLITYSGILIGFVNLLILQPYLLTPEEVGLVRILFSVSLLFSSIFPVGISAFTVKYFPYFRNPEKGHSGFFWVITGMTALLFIFFAGIGYLFKDVIIEKYSVNSPLFASYFHYVLPMSLFMGFLSVLTIYCFALFKPNIPSFLNEVLNRIAFTFMLSLYYIKIITLHEFITGYVFIYGFQLLLLLFFILKNDRVSFFPKWKFFKPLLTKKNILFTFMLGFAGIASIGLKNVDVAMLGSFVTLDKVAVYSVAVLIGSMIEVPANVLNRITDTRISDSIAKNDMATVSKIYFDSVRYLTVLGGFLFLILNINLAYGLQLLPEKYQTGNSVTVIISISALINMITGTNSSIIYYSEKYLYGILLLAFLILSTVLLNLYLIPYFGILGAAMATALAIFLYNVIKYFIIYRMFHLQPYKSSYLILLLAFILGLLVNYYLPTLSNLIGNIFFRNAIVLIIYLVGIYFSGIIPEFFKKKK